MVWIRVFIGHVKCHFECHDFDQTLSALQQYCRRKDCGACAVEIDPFI